MPKIPGSFNGGIPGNLVWNPLNPPVKNGCCDMVTVHDPSCDGNCEKTPIRETECELINENREWARLGIDTNFIRRDLFKMGNQINALINIITRTVDKDELNDEYRRCMVDEMQRIRLAHQDEIKRANLGIPPQGILGPDGKPL